MIMRHRANAIQPVRLATFATCTAVNANASQMFWAENVINAHSVFGSLVRTAVNRAIAIRAAQNMTIAILKRVNAIV